MRQLPLFAGGLLLGVLFVSSGPARALPTVFYGGSEGIQSIDAVNAGPGDRITIWSTLSSADPDDLAVDNSGGRIYWAETDSIRSAALDGSGSIDDLVTGLVFPRGPELDVAAGKVYWASGASIQRSNLDGTNVETIHTAGSALRDLAVDVVAGHIYYLALNSVRRVDLDGANDQFVLSSFANRIEVDPMGGKLYLPRPFNGTIGQADLDGQNFTNILTGLLGPGALVVDSTGGKIYFRDGNFSSGPNPTRIRRANLDGSGLEDVVDFTGVLSAADGGIALGPTLPEPSALTFLALGILLLTARFHGPRVRSAAAPPAAQLR